MNIIDNPLDEGNHENIDTWVLFIQKETSHYIKAWTKLSKENTKISFNLGAALGGTIWAGYRKMYWLLPINIGLFIIAILSENIPFFEQHPIFSQILLLGNPFFFGFFGNYLYYKSSTKKINQVLQDNNEKEEKLKQAGGVNITFLILGPLFALIILYFLILLLSIVGLTKFDLNLMGQ